jgi:hypothetical protein
VTLSVPRATGAGFYNTRGQIVRFVDLDGNGVADGPGQVLYDNLPGSLSGLRVDGPLVFAFSNGAQISVMRFQGGPDSALDWVGNLNFNLPNGWYHPPSNLIVRRHPEDASLVDVVFQVGSFANFAASSVTARLTGTGGVLGVDLALKGDAIHRVTLQDTGTTLQAVAWKQLATGLRNPAGFAWHPTTGALWFEDNGIDGLVDANEPLSADELNILPDAAWNGDLVADFGFPSTYIQYRTGQQIGAQGIAPWVAFLPLPHPADGSESEGPSDIEFAPPGFPPGLDNGVFVGFHGKFNLGGIANEENPLVYVDAVTGVYFQIIGNDEAGIGHLDGLAGTEDSLFMTDLSSVGSVGGAGAAAGKIYQIKSLYPPRLTIHTEGGRIVVTRTHGTLQKAPAPEGPWTEVLAASRVHTLEPVEVQLFLRAIAR